MAFVKNQESRQHFTVANLIGVIALTAVVVFVVIAILSTVTEKMRDNQRIEDLEKI